MKRLLIYGTLLLGLGIFWTCSVESPRTVTPAFYHWKNRLDISTSELQYLDRLKAKKLYLRFFDVDWQGNQAIPLAVLESETILADSFQIIPTVFITNRTMLNISNSGLPSLGDQILKKINQLAQSFQSTQIQEVQFDCDWSAKSKNNYFQLLTYLKEKFAEQDWQISATIRLHQVKYYQQTGVPDVDRGVLMFYNMDDIDQIDTKNSILYIPTAKQYLSNFENYPLTLDLALPIFKWGLIFQENKLVKIINNLDSQALQDTSRFIKIAENRFEIIKSTYLKGHYLYQKDFIRLEQVAPAQLQEAADLLSSRLTNQELNLIFYHLDSLQIADYPHEVLEDICHRFH